MLKSLPTSCKPDMLGMGQGIGIVKSFLDISSVQLGLRNSVLGKGSISHLCPDFGTATGDEVGWGAIHSFFPTESKSSLLKG